ncbi:MAG: hypothetical protein ACO29V_11270 [Limnohabitans sp.]
MSVSITWNIDKVIGKADRIVKAYAPIIGEQLKAEINKAQFDWPNPTRRKNGRVVSSPRNIVDTGAFVNSQALELQPFTAKFSWPVQGKDGFYSQALLTGWQTPSGRKPGRDWITPALTHYPFPVFFKGLWTSLPIR